jgi:hypothetical protein
MMRDKSLWGDDADVFNPDRWMKGDTAAIDKFYMPVRLICNSLGRVYNRLT